ncbi:MAG: penicillin-binding transpeptidase domain-containing protein [Gemmatimonadaceae bacterium]
MPDVSWLRGALMRCVNPFLIALGATTPLPMRLAAQQLHQCVVVWDSRTGRESRTNDAECGTRLSPASTFKIPHALVALQVGAIGPHDVERWDGTKYPNTPVWQADYTVATAIRPSVVWFFQRIAPRVGAERMHQRLQQLQYGNAATDGDVTRYWLNGTLRVSPIEQVAFLRNFFASRAPFDSAWTTLVREALVQPPDSIENAMGKWPMGEQWPAGAVWRAKTGFTSYDGRTVNWLVGEIVEGSRRRVFASAVWRDGGTVGNVDAAHLAAQVLFGRAARP